MYLDEYKKWLDSTMLSEDEKEELRSIANDEKEIENRFYTNLSFGTAGMRGIRGIGKNRMNKYNIRKATQGLANYIIEATGETGKKKGVAIAYDSRLDSVENAINTAMTLAGNGIKVYLFPLDISSLTTLKITLPSARGYLALTLDIIAFISFIVALGNSFATILLVSFTIVAVETLSGRN